MGVARFDHVMCLSIRSHDKQIKWRIKWVSFKEILFLFISCSVLAFLLRLQDTIQFKLVLIIITGEDVARENYANHKFPPKMKNWKLMCSVLLFYFLFSPLPIVTDLESDGQTGK